MRQSYPWWKTGVIYQIYPRSYLDTTGNGVGDLEGVIKKISYLAQTLGVDALWLSPFYPSPMKDFGYDVADYCDVDPIFGTLGDFDRLLEAAHQEGLKIIIDLVPNHSSDLHPWFIESRSSRDNPRRDWYVWQDPGPDGGPPNNWLSVFGGSAWEWDSESGQYYLHSFLKEQPDLNWRNPEVKEAMFDVVRFWLDRGVDGFRIDVAHYIMKDPQLRDNPLNQKDSPAIHRSLGEYDTQIHLYDKGHPDVHLVYKELRKILDRYSQISPRVSIGEIHIFDWEVWASYYGTNQDEIHLPFNFSLLNTAWEAKSIQNQVDSLEGVLNPGDWPNYVLGNHDESRLASRIGKRQARLAAMLLLTLRGTPTIYYGEEIGMVDGQIPPESELDPAGLNQPGQGQGRDICRTPMQWNSQPWAGFSPPETNKTWLPVGGNYRDLNVENQLNKEGSFLQLYRRLLKLRNEHPGLQIGDYQPLPDAPEGCFFYTRYAEGETLLVALNFNSHEVTYNTDDIAASRILLSTNLDREGSTGQELSLKPLEGCLLKL